MCIILTRIKVCQCEVSVRILSNWNSYTSGDNIKIQYTNRLRSSVQFSRSVVSNSLRPHGLQHARLPCLSPTPRACSNLCPLSQWYRATISSLDYTKIKVFLWEENAVNKTNRQKCCNTDDRQKLISVYIESLQIINWPF